MVDEIKRYMVGKIEFDNRAEAEAFETEVELYKVLEKSGWKNSEVNLLVETVKNNNKAGDLIALFCNRYSVIRAWKNNKT